MPSLQIDWDALVLPLLEARWPRLVDDEAQLLSESGPSLPVPVVMTGDFCFALK